MIVSLVASALLFTASVALVAAAAEPLARALRRSTRWVWCTALVVGALWPPLAPIVIRAMPGIQSVATVLPQWRVVSERDGARQPSGDVAARVAAALWMAASLILAARLLRAALVLRGLRRQAERRILDGVPVLLTDRVGPATVGLRRHVVIVPRDLLNLEESLRQLVLRHEREHCDAHDPWLIFGAAIAVALVPWNVALWYIARRLRLAIEIDCDARVLAGGADETGYGRLLLWVAHGRVTLPFAPAFATPPSHLERRITAMRTRFARPRPLRLLGAGTLAVVAIAAACSAGLPGTPPTRTVQEAAPALPHPAATSVAKDSFFEFRVDRTAAQVPGTGMVRYPAATRLSHREGVVVSQFVVDTRGEVEVSTFKVLESTDAAFTAAVRSALPEMRFTPALVQGRPVKQLVQQSFTFSPSGVQQGS